VGAGADIIAIWSAATAREPRRLETRQRDVNETRRNLDQLQNVEVYITHGMRRRFLVIFIFSKENSDFLVKY
jgi:hypothetical protein